MEVDASQYAMGAVLYQRDETGRPMVVGYHLKTFNMAERGYHIHDRQLLDLIRGLRRWRHILLSSPFQTKVYTDHANLKYFHEAHKINRRVARYLNDLAEFDFSLVHIPGKNNRADALSRPPGTDTGENDNEDVQVLPHYL